MLKRGIIPTLLLILSVPGFAETNTNSIHIHAPLTHVYDYITRPDKWHDWYPNSKSANTPGGSLKRGQMFTEVVTVNQTEAVFEYEVTNVRKPSLWRVEFSSPMVLGSIQYQLQETLDGTLLTRTLEYYPSPSNKEQLAQLQKSASQVQLISTTALLKLREHLEAAWQAQ